MPVVTPGGLARQALGINPELLLLLGAHGLALLYHVASLPGDAFSLSHDALVQLLQVRRRDLAAGIQALRELRVNSQRAFLISEDDTHSRTDCWIVDGGALQALCDGTPATLTREVSRAPMQRMQGMPACVHASHAGDRPNDRESTERQPDDSSREGEAAAYAAITGRKLRKPKRAPAERPPINPPPEQAPTKAELNKMDNARAVAEFERLQNNRIEQNHALKTAARHLHALYEDCLTDPDPVVAAIAARSLGMEPPATQAAGAVPASQVSAQLLAQLDKVKR